MKKSKTKSGLSLILTLVIGFSLVLPINASSQPPSIKWQKTYGASSGDSLVKASDGGFAIAATVGGSTGGYNEIIKTDKDGNILWNVTIGDTAISDEWIMATSDGGYAVVRRSDNSSLIGSLIKVNAEGTMQWNKTFVQNGNETFIDYAIHTRDDGFALIGQIATGKTWVAKTDSEGNIQWEKTYDNFNGTLIAETTDGGYVYAGDSGGAQVGLFESDLAKTDQLGNIQLEKVYENQLGFRPRSLITTSDSGFMLAGARYFNNTFVSAFALKTDSNGDLEWNKTYGGNSGFRIAIENIEGNYIFAGGVYTSEPQYFARLVQTDELGNMEWEKTYEGQGNGYVYSLVQYENDSYVFTGATSEINSSTTKMWTIKIAPTQNELSQQSWIIIAATAVVGIAIIASSGMIYRRRKPRSKPAIEKNLFPKNFRLYVMSTFQRYTCRGLPGTLLCLCESVNG